MLLKTHAKNHKVFVHATIPIADTEDQSRLEKLRLDDHTLLLNHVPTTGLVRLGMVNVCNHRAHECDCMKYYDHVFALSVHSSYYFSQRDYAQIHKFTPYLRCIGHMPMVGRTIPMTKQPEYEWKSGEDHGSWTQRLAAKMNRVLTGERTVVMVPLRTGETEYRHADTSDFVRNGGYHDGPLLRTVTKHYSTPIKQAVALTASFASAAIPALMTTPGPLPVKVAAAVSSGVTAATLTAVAARTIIESSKCVSPPWWADSTVTTHITNTYGITDTQEEIVHNFTVRRRKPENLVRKVVESTQVDSAGANRTAAAILSAGDNDKTYRKMASNLLRDSLPVNVVKGTLDHAKNLCVYLVPPSRDLGSQRRGWQYALAGACLPLASATNQWAVSTLYAGSLRAGQTAIAQPQLWIMRGLLIALAMMSSMSYTMLLLFLMGGVWAMCF